MKRNYGSGWVHLLLAVPTIWWLSGTANLLYAGYKYLSDSERTVVWKGGSPADRPTESATAAL